MQKNMILAIASIGFTFITGCAATRKDIKEIVAAEIAPVQQQVAAVERKTDQLGTFTTQGFKEADDRLQTLAAQQAELYQRTARRLEEVDGKTTKVMRALPPLAKEVKGLRKETGDFRAENKKAHAELVAKADEVGKMVADEGTTTRKNVEAEGLATRGALATAASDIRKDVASEAAATRSAASADGATTRASVRTHVTSEMAAATATIRGDIIATRGDITAARNDITNGVSAIRGDVADTRKDLADQGNLTRSHVSTEETTTRTTTQAEVGKVAAQVTATDTKLSGQVSSVDSKVDAAATAAANLRKAVCSIPGITCPPLPLR